jgi:hypothetical protein
MITQEELKKLLHYNPESGLLTWLVTKSNRAYKGNVAGTIVKGHIRIRINSRNYEASQLIWLYVYGQFIPRVDHKDRDGLNNRLINLRPATRSQNAANSNLSARNTSGYKGVYWSKKMNCWWAAITVNGRQKSLGCFDNPESAFEAYKIAATKAFGEFANPARA